MAEPTKNRRRSRDFHVSDRPSHEDQRGSPMESEDLTTPLGLGIFVDSEVDRILKEILADESGASVMTVEDEASSHFHQKDGFADASDQQPGYITEGLPRSSELESSYQQVLLGLRELRSLLTPEEQKIRIDDISIQLRIWGNEVWDKSGYSKVLTQVYYQEAYAMNMMIALMNQTIKLMQASSAKKEFETFLDSMHNCVENLCDIFESLRMREKIRTKTDPVTRLTAHRSANKTLPDPQISLSENSWPADQTYAQEPLLSKVNADSDSELDQDDILANVEDHSFGGSQVRTRAPKNPHLAAIQGNPSLGINVDSKHPSAHTRSNLHSSAASIRSISDRGDALYEQSRSHYDPLPLNAPRYGIKADLQPALHAALVATEGVKQSVYKCFYPKGSLDQLITTQIVHESISESVRSGAVRLMDTGTIQQYAEKVCGPGDTNSNTRVFMKMFTILVLADAPSLIVDCVDEDLNDSDLPLGRIDSVSDYRSFQRNLYRKSRAEEPIKCLENWSIPGRTSFYTYQWTTIAPFFASAGRAQRINIYKLTDDDILPWTKKFSMREYGGYSEVSRVIIHRNHHNFGDRKDNDGTFAVKKLRYEEVQSDQSGTSAIPSQTGSTHTTGTFEDRARQQFRDEIEVLERFSNDAHNHLISLLAAFQKGRSCYLLFDWAHSDLLQFWKNTMPGPHLEEKSVKWLIDQMLGISDGLYRIHSYKLSNNSTQDPNFRATYGRHGNISPQNFLIFKQEIHSLPEPVIKLTDFGLKRFQSETSRSGIRQSKSPGFSPSYRSPELDLEGGEISRSLDIWSLGCVFLEFITWHFGGWVYLHEFVMKRLRKDIITGHKTDQFFEFVQNLKNTEEHGLRIKKEVLEWIADLHMRPDCSDLMHDVLDFIETRMLAVIPPSENTDPPRTRANIDEVLEKFAYLKNRAGSADYSLMGRPKVTYVDTSAISVNMTLDTSKKDEIRKDHFEVRRGDQEYKVTIHRSQTEFLFIDGFGDEAL